MTRLAHILAEQKVSYTSVAERAELQPRTVRQLASGETPMDNVAIGTVRRIAAALSVSLADLLEQEPVQPGDASLTREARLSAAIREVMWLGSPGGYASPVEVGTPDGIADLSPDDFFADMPAIDASRG